MMRPTKKRSETLVIILLIIMGVFSGCQTFVPGVSDHPFRDEYALIEEIPTGKSSQFPIFAPVPDKLAWFGYGEWLLSRGSWPEHEAWETGAAKMYPYIICAPDVESMIIGFPQLYNDYDYSYGLDMLDFGKAIFNPDYRYEYSHHWSGYPDLYLYVPEPDASVSQWFATLNDDFIQLKKNDVIEGFGHGNKQELAKLKALMSRMGDGSSYFILTSPPTIMTATRASTGKLEEGELGFDRRDDIDQHTLEAIFFLFDEIHAKEMTYADVQEYLASFHAMRRKENSDWKIGEDKREWR